MISLRKFLLFLVLTILFTLPCQTAAARVRMGILALENHADAPEAEAMFPDQLQTACGNLVTVQSYHDNTTLVNMLTRFGKLEAILITQAAYDQQASPGLSSFADIKISDNAHETNLVLAVRADMPDALHTQLLEGYQELLLSQEGLGLLELYASRQSNKPVALSSPQSSKVPETNTPVAEAAVQTTIRKPTDHVNAPAEPVHETNPAVANSPHAATQAPPLIKTVQGQDPELMPVPANSPTQNRDAGEPTATTSNTQVHGAHIEVTGGLEKHLAYGEAELFAPLRQHPDDLWFGDVRLRIDDNDSEEYSFGLGYRKIIGNSWILGGYAFYDRHLSTGGKSYNQGTLGIEALTGNYTARTNIYLPESDSNILQSTGTVVQEKALRGVDAEFGMLLPVEKQEVRCYLGGYHFSEPAGEDINGSSARLEYRFRDILGWLGSHLEISGGIRHDDLRDTDYFVQASGRIPLGRTQSARRSLQHDFSAQLTEQPQRLPVFILERHITP